jgi:hypothetical protein
MKKEMIANFVANVSVLVTAMKEEDVEVSGST